MVTSLKEMLELLNFGHMNTFTIKFQLCDKILYVISWTSFIRLHNPGVANFTDVIKTTIMYQN